MEDTLNTLSSDGSSILSESSLSQPSVLEEREHLKVYLRIRPFTAAETQNGESQDCVSMEPPDTVLLRPPSAFCPLSINRSLPHPTLRFRFSQVYGADTTQRELFQGTVKNLVKDVLQGGNSLVFTYGVTNAGKTFTFLGPDGDAGILPRTLDMVFSSIEDKILTGMSVKPQRCREFSRLSEEEQAEEAAFKNNLLKDVKDSDTLDNSLWSCSRIILEDDRLSLLLDADIKFSVWVSFCEIYNESIHDLLEATPSGAPRRTTLRLCQDVKGNAFIKDLRWVQVDTAEEAYNVMKLGKKNQSFSSTRLNHLSSRSHSIFSIRILRVKDAGLSVSELCLCDLAGSERCSKTGNQGERLREAGNINASLLILGKCINALRHNQQARLHQHVPFRESKLTHYLQAFLCGRGKACMMVNINQCASMYDETLNVLKFSAVAQKVVLLPSKPPRVTPQRTESELSSMGEGWESSLEDVQEDEDEENMTSMEDDFAEMDDEQRVGLLRQLQVALKKERADSMLVEARVREEICAEFSKLFSEMQEDFAQRLAREREILEKRGDERLDIFKRLADKMSACDAAPHAPAEGSTQARNSRSSLDSYSSEVASVTTCGHASHVGGGPREDAGELERNVLKLGEEEDEERKRLVAELQDKSSAVEELEKQVNDLQAAADQNYSLQQDTKKLQVGFNAQSHAVEPRFPNLIATIRNKKETLGGLQKEMSSKEEVIAALEEKILKTEVLSEKQQEDLRAQAASCDHLRGQLSEQQHTAEHLKTQLQQAEEEGSRLNAELASLRERAASVEEETPPTSSDAEVQADASTHAELEKKLQDQEAQIKALQKNLQDVQQRREEADSHAVQETRRLEVERRRELLAVAHEAIALKDAELEKRAQEISSLKESSKQDSEKVRILTLDLERKEEDAGDLREKLADYKKQIQQVHNEISTMKEEEKLLRQKLSDVEKVKKQLQSDVANRDRTIQQMKLELPVQAKGDETQQMYHKACQELEEKQRAMEDMRSALMEQEETQQQMEQVLEEKAGLVQELTSELDKVKGLLRKQNGGKDSTPHADGLSHDLELAKQKAARAEENLKLWEEKQLAERHRWKGEKLALIGQIKEAEDKRNQEMKKFVEDRERYLGQQVHLEAQLAHKEQTMVTWREERDALVAALEVQLHKLLASQAQKDKLIQQLQESSTEGGDSLAAPLVESEGRGSQDLQSSPQATDGEKTPCDATLNRKLPAARECRASSSSQTSSSNPSVLDSSQISTENGKASRFPQPELEISFSPLQPNRMALRRQGHDDTVTVKITRSARKRKSSEMEKCHMFRRTKRRTNLQDEVEAENRRNTKVTPTPTAFQESPRPAAHPSQSSIRSRKEGTLQKIGDFLQSSPTLLGTKAKKMMGLVSGRSDADAASATSPMSLRVKRKKKLFRPQISSPMSMPPHLMVSNASEEKDSDHAILRRCLRSAKKKTSTS
ncbi:kinesin-like protein KIF20B isoform X2 [Nerophis ophidion]|uniref:kinesin-like protein KIF20B isoform X2 n=1 Tax=Nerophis ophidion TaxID=159077 RepID=UPI002AE09B25|nr:kinesin-like protein KIF20B isoform X2 [Nerophis ophidion]